jgi:hypothetical protein
MTGDLAEARLKLARDLAPFLGAAILAWVAIVVSSPVEWAQYVASIALAGVAAVLTLLRLRITGPHGSGSCRRHWSFWPQSGCFATRPGA